MSNYEIEQVQDHFKILGKLSYENIVSLYREGTTLLDRSEQICFDLAKISHTDSSAIALLLSWIRYAMRNKKSFIFKNLPPQLIEIANVCEVMPLLERHLK
jgi:phospholipid transport system transporter-binding protein